MTQISIFSNLVMLAIAHNRFYRPLEDIKVGIVTGTCTGTISKPLLVVEHVSPKSLTCLVCFLQNAVDGSCVDESQDKCEERDSIQEAHETKKACDRKRDFGSKKDSTKAQYWLDPERKKDSVKAYYDQNRELILASKQAQYQANPKEKKSYELGVYRLGAICPSLFTRKRTVYPLRVFLRVVCELQCYSHSLPQCKLSTLCKLADGLLV